MKTLQQLINSINDNLITKTRDNGDEFQCFKNDAPEYCSDLAHHVHDGMMPDDWRYSFLYNVIAVLTNSDGQSLNNLLSGDYDVYEIAGEPSVYNYDLLKWQSSNLTRMEYADEVIEEGTAQSLSALLMQAQLTEMVEVAEMVICWLESQQCDLWEDVA